MTFVYVLVRLAIAGMMDLAIDCDVFRAIDLYNRFLEWQKTTTQMRVHNLIVLYLACAKGFPGNLSGLSGFELHFSRGPWCLCRVFCMFL